LASAKASASGSGALPDWEFIFASDLFKCVQKRSGVPPRCRGGFTTRDYRSRDFPSPFTAIAQYRLSHPQTVLTKSGPMFRQFRRNRSVTCSCISEIGVVDPVDPDTNTCRRPGPRDNSGHTGHRWRANAVTLEAVDKCCRFPLRSLTQYRADLQLKPYCTY